MPRYAASLNRDCLIAALRLLRAWLNRSRRDLIKASRRRSTGGLISIGSLLFIAGALVIEDLIQGSSKIAHPAPAGKGRACIRNASQAVNPVMPGIFRGALQAFPLPASLWNGSPPRHHSFDMAAMAVGVMAVGVIDVEVIDTGLIDVGAIDAAVMNVGLIDAEVSGIAGIDVVVIDDDVIDMVAMLSGAMAVMAIDIAAMYIMAMDIEIMNTEAMDKAVMDIVAMDIRVMDMVARGIGALALASMAVRAKRLDLWDWD